MPKNLESDLAALKAVPDEEISLNDIPELGDDFFKNAILNPPTKTPITIRLDSDVVAWFKSQGPGYQTRINLLLRRYMEALQR